VLRTECAWVEHSVSYFLTCTEGPATVLSPALRWESQGTQGCVYQAAVIKYSF
jgi:hypothetical protein